MPFRRAWFGGRAAWRPGLGLGRGRAWGIGRFAWGNPYARGWPGYGMSYGYPYGGYGFAHPGYGYGMGYPYGRYPW